MRTLAILFTLFYFLNALAVAPLGFKGQNQSTTYPSVVQVPGQLMTKTSGSESLIETGNKNILLNPSFEAPLVSFAAPSWSSLGFLTNNITPPVSGLKAVQVSMTASALSLHQDSGLNNAAYGDGLQCLASVYVRTSLSGIFVSPRLNNVTSTSNMVSVVPNGKWALYKVPFICSTGANGIAIHSNGIAVTGSVDVDDAFVAAVDLKVDGTTITTQTSSASAIATLAAGATLTTTPTTVGSGLYSFSSGIYTALDTIKVDLTASMRAGVTQVQSAININGSVQAQDYTNVVTAWASASWSGTIQKGQTFYFVNSSAIGSSDQQTTQVIATKAISSSTYSSTNADTDWASCTPSSSQGFGTPTYALQCKRQGSDLLMKGTFTSGTSSGVEARIGLPLWNGVQLNSAGLSIIPSIQAAGLGGRSDGSNALGLLVEPSVSYLTFGQYADGVRPLLTKQNGNIIASSGTIVSFTARIPIEGWQGSNIIVGSFSGLQNCTSTLACTDTFSAYVSAAGVVSNENVDWISGNCSVVSTNQYTCTYVSGLVTQPMNCQAVVSDNVTITSNANMYAGTSTSLAYQTYKNIDSVAIAQPVSLSCQKQGADYVGKTALAVASDQNVRSIGSTGMDIQSVHFAGAAISTSCTTSPCVIYNSVGSKITSVTRNSTGDYNLNGIDGTKYICNGGGNSSAYVGFSHRRDLSSSTLARVQFGSAATPLDTNNTSVTCIGIP